MLGPHIPKVHNARQLISVWGWDCYQTQLGNPRSLEIPYLGEADDCNNPLWIGHAAFVAHATPKYAERTAYYFSELIKRAANARVHTIVIHSGAVSGKFLCIVLDEMERFLKYLYPILEEYDMTLAMEFSASTCAFNLDPQSFIERFEDTRIGYCFDLAHTYAAGCMWENIRKCIKTTPPLVAHINYPGTEHGSSRDVHGWRSKPEYIRRGKTLCLRHYGIDELISEYDTTIRLLQSLKVPMILEGSQFEVSNIMTELKLVKEILCMSQSP